MSESTVKIGSDSEPSSEKSDNFEEIVDDVSSTGSNENKNHDDDFDNTLPETVVLLHHEETGAKVYLVGTAHFSQESKDDVAKVMRDRTDNLLNSMFIFTGNKACETARRSS